MYLQHSLKGGSARNVIESLSCSGEYYAKAVECLQSRYDRPRLIHQTHVCTILEAPTLNDGSSKRNCAICMTLYSNTSAVVPPLDRKFNVPCTNLFGQRSTHQFMHETASGNLLNIHQLITSEQDILFTSSLKVDIVRVQTSELHVSARLNFELHASTN